MARRVGLNLVCEMCANASANGLPWLVARDRVDLEADGVDLEADGVDLEADGAQLAVAEEDGIVGPGPPLWYTCHERPPVEAFCLSFVCLRERCRCHTLWLTIV